MAVDPVTGQSLLAYMDPTAFGQLQGDRSHADLLGQLGQQMLQSGYTPNSGWGGALAQIAQAIAGSAALNKSQEQIAGLGQRQVQALSAAEEKKRAQQAADDEAKNQRDIAKALAEKEGGIKLGLQYGDQTSAAEAKAAGAKALAEGTATLPLHEQEARFKANLDAQNRQPAEFERKMAAAKQMGASPEELRAMVIGNQGNTPSGYRPAAGGLEPIPGGPADPNTIHRQGSLTAEAKTKLSLIDNAINNAKRYAERTVGPNGEFKDVESMTHDTPQLITSAIQDMLYAKSGASAPQAEVDKAMAMYAPSRYFGVPTERDTTASAKVQNLIGDLTNMRNEIAQGTPSGMAVAPSNSPVHYVYDIKTGKLVPQQ
jgi:hypothetical protein